ncbi:UDP-3-O-[3-hydroxymyristoyl] N-acetylglucosamine deacetylase [Syntrophus gentianae]|uniref:UDP-3-O-acyl-N-acetylglucosamine deacetylase n=1 Tax=Syntrophus gentianae TaxID=43775 RepID=A0A1H7U8T1_9BACT|nr:UDP-3-O-acyl-N-acetylglucosamine deacetylase [Syntrophus gentianae]SEL93078.1 UDP-3-O-[3-hydroxymyristoyl] N-acetylglucosamine deacetylase [Syntrophus gentianae]
MNFQRTLKSELTCQSVGLHSGRKINMTIKPAASDAGILLVRKDKNYKQKIKVSLDNVTDTTLATTIGNNGTAISTVEHILSAFSGMGVDNAVVEVDGPEIPIMDGSALPFVEMLKKVGTCTQEKLKKYLIVKEPVYVSEGESHAMFVPSSSFEITYKIEFGHPAIGVQSYHLKLSDETYAQEICSSRTFGFLKDVEYLQARGLALGGSLKNAVILDETRIINKEGLRSPDEFVKHKILDAIGDLSLIGMPIVGHFIAYKSGHKLNAMLLKELLEHQENWTTATVLDIQESYEELNTLDVPSYKILDAVHV